MGLKPLIVAAAGALLAVGGLTTCETFMPSGSPCPPTLTEWCSQIGAVQPVQIHLDGASLAEFNAFASDIGLLPSSDLQRRYVLALRDAQISFVSTLGAHGVHARHDPDRRHVHSRNSIYAWVAVADLPRLRALPGVVAVEPADQRYAASLMTPPQR